MAELVNNEIPQPESTPVDLREDGLLWLINRTVFHPRGFALGIDIESGGFVLYGNGDEPWDYRLPDGEENQLFLAAEAAMARVTLAPRPL
jgi:hypothetical protein